MRKFKLAKLFVGLASLFSVALASCGGSGGGGGSAVKAIYLSSYTLDLIPDEQHRITVTTDPEDAVGFRIVWESSDPAIATVTGGLVTAVGSGTCKVTATVKDTTIKESCTVTVAEPFHDYTTDGSVVLNLDYQGHTFYKDGIEQVTLQTPIDGDTAHFKDSNNVTIKCRFYGIDTPESTGKVQPWGYEASEFTTEKLNEAAKNGTIVVSSPKSEYGTPDPDSTGSRYVSLIWINTSKKNAARNELQLLNLWIVQEGYSMPKNVSDIPEYTNSFNAAYDQAQVYKKNMWSGERAPHFNYDGDYQDVSLLDIKREVQEYFKDPTHKNKYDNVKVRFTGVVSSYSDGNLYVQEFYPGDEDDPSDDEWAGINIFCGMSEISTKFTVPNTYVQVYGLCKDSETFGFQITDTQGRWKPYGAGENDCKVILTAEQNIDDHKLYTFEYTAAELSTVAKNVNCESLFCSVKVTDTVTCNRAFINDSGEATLYFTGQDWNVYLPYVYKGDPDNPQEIWNTVAHFEGKTFRVNAGTYAWHKTQSGKLTFQIIPTKVSGNVALEWVK